MPIAPPPHNPNIVGPSAARVASPQMPTPILRKTEKRKLTISDTSDSDTSSIRKSKRQKKSTTSIVEKIKNTEEYSTEIPESNTELLEEVSPRNPNERWTRDPNPNLPREMTVLQAKNQDQSDSEKILNKLSELYILSIIYYFTTYIAGEYLLIF